MRKHTLILVVVLLTTLFWFNGMSQESISQPLKSSLEQSFMHHEWIINKILGLDEETETYKLIVRDRTKPGKFAGNLVRFLEKGSFVSEYTAWCGNDNFTWLNGEYQFLGNDQIAINVKNIQYFGEWDKPEEHRETNWIIFSVTQEEDTVLLTKQKK